VRVAEVHVDVDRDLEDDMCDHLLTWHDAGPGVVVDAARALPEQLAHAAAARFPEVFQVSVRADLLRDPADVDRVAAEVSAKLLEADVGTR